jgi:uncharacterized membrane protein YphA (DoxX/SURF4 family)
MSPATTAARTETSKSLTAARIVLGLAFFVFGLNGFLHFIPQPPPEGTAAAYLGGLAASGYMFPFIKGTEVLVGIALLAGRYVPLALTVLAPITLNIVAFHAFLAPAGTALPLALLALHVFLAVRYRAVFAPMLAARVEVTGTSAYPAARPVHAAAE